MCPPRSRRRRRGKIPSWRTLDGVGYGVDTAAATTVAAGTAALVAGAVSSDARGGMGSAASAVGSALLAFAKELPWVAPIAVLIGGVATAAANVHALKRDAQVFATNVKSVETVMMETGKKGLLAKVEDTAQALAYEMEEGVAFLNKLKNHFITQMLMSGRDSQKFKDISDSMHRQVTIIAPRRPSRCTTSSSRSLSRVAAQGEDRGARRRGRDHGGPGEEGDEKEFMSASDQLIVSAVDDVTKAVKLAEGDRENESMP